MLEERLSHTYGQLTIGGYASRSTRPSSSIYPSIPSVPPSTVGNYGGAESFYTGNAAPPSEAYNYPQSTYDSHASPQSPQAIYARGPPSSATYASGIPPDYQGQQQATYLPQRTTSIQGYAAAPAQRNESGYFADHTHQTYAPQGQTLQQGIPTVPSYQASQPPVSPSTNQNTSYYQAGHHPGPSYQQTQPSPQISQPSPELYHQPEPFQQAMPQQAIPQQAMPQQTMLQQAMPQQAMPQQAMPQQTMLQQAMPQQAMPQQAMPQQAMPQQAMPPQAMPPQAMPPQANQQLTQQYPQPQQTFPKHQSFQSPPTQQQGYRQSLQPSPSILQPAHQASRPYLQMAAYTQDSFPTAPSHQPQPKPVIVEEALIEL
jgi:growth factor-regulated tyrosine kinase substrate